MAIKSWIIDVDHGRKLKQRNAGVFVRCNTGGTLKSKGETCRPFEGNCGAGALHGAEHADLSP